ncbi:hypothetical protein CKO25_05315 [Thiocapsa imhoffii]|uniref:Uncharacterized protein n=1 Tax=Thiocapsa imhoffii TaxID=382777 RepID=A0A9X0WGX4_9GAMM|nr:hypothetical protein [Thiocapsa imhoffii]MBK1644079.1 hypothetical protein [Thiocapsa imhoffii]
MTAPHDAHRSDAVPTEATDAPADRPSDADRRAALAKLGTLAAWTAPVMLTMTLPKRASAFSQPPGGPGPEG